MNGTLEQKAVDLALDQVILRAVRDRFERKLFIPGAAEDDDRHHGRPSVYAIEGRQSLTVGQPEVQQEHIERLAPHAVEHLVQPRQPVHLEGSSRGLAKQLLNEARVARIVFHEANRQWIPHHRGVRGSVTMVNQKSSMDRIASRNCGSPNGLTT
jgi:hypothetical protein